MIRIIKAVFSVLLVSSAALAGDLTITMSNANASDDRSTSESAETVLRRIVVMSATRNSKLTTE